MNILIATDKFKGSLSSREACGAIREGIERARGKGVHEIRCIPVSDGGEGLTEALVGASGGRWKSVSTRDALGEPIDARYGLSPDGKTAFVEMAEASGLARLGERPLDPWRASTFGTGEMLRDAARQGVDRILLGLGGSATNDGGSGMALAMGFRFLDESGREIRELPERLPETASVKEPETSPLPPVTVACDVRNPLLGPEGSTRVYGPQKGVAEDDYERHEARLAHLLEVLGPDAGRLAARPGAGAAGGLGFGCLYFLRAGLEPGFELVARALDLETAVKNADIVLTGEGRIDRQSLEGKAPHGVAELAKQHDKQRAAFCGSLEDTGLEEVFGPIYAIGDPELSLAENLARGHESLVRAAAEMAARWE